MLSGSWPRSAAQGDACQSLPSCVSPACTDLQCSDLEDRKRTEDRADPSSRELHVCTLSRCYAGCLHLVRVTQTLKSVQEFKLRCVEGSQHLLGNSLLQTIRQPCRSLARQAEKNQDSRVFKGPILHSWCMVQEQSRLIHSVVCRFSKQEQVSA